MRWLLTLLCGSFVSLCLWMLVNRDHNQKLLGKDFSVKDLNPKEIVESYKKTVQKVEGRNNALLAEEIDAEGLGGATHAMKEAANAQLRAQEAQLQALDTPTVRSKAPQGRVPPDEVDIEGRTLEAITDADFQMFKGMWSYTGHHPQTGREERLHLHIKDHNEISRIQIELFRGETFSMGTNRIPLWRDRVTSDMLFVVSETLYLVLARDHQNLLRATVYRKKNGGGFIKGEEYPLTRR